MKTYTILFENYWNKTFEFRGSLQELTEKFSLTLLSGHSRDKKISTNPKSIKALINSINRSYNVIHESRFTRDFVYLKKS
jgi:hypothetical protein